MEQSIPLSELKANLQKEISDDIKHSKKRAIGNYWIAYFAMVIALGCAGAAGFGGLLKIIPNPTILGLLAFVPPGVASFAAQLKPQQRANYHYKRMYALKALLSKLNYQQNGDDLAAHIGAVAKARDKLVEKMDAEWERTITFDWRIFGHHAPHEQDKT